MAGHHPQKPYFPDSRRHSLAHDRPSQPPEAGEVCVKCYKDMKSESLAFTLTVADPVYISEMKKEILSFSDSGHAAFLLVYFTFL